MQEVPQFWNVVLRRAPAVLWVEVPGGWYGWVESLSQPQPAVLHGCVVNTSADLWCSSPCGCFPTDTSHVHSQGSWISAPSCWTETASHQWLHCQSPHLVWKLPRTQKSGLHHCCWHTARHGSAANTLTAGTASFWRSLFQEMEGCFLIPAGAEHMAVSAVPYRSSIWQTPPAVAGGRVRVGEKQRGKCRTLPPQQMADQRPPELEITLKLLSLAVLCGFLFDAVIFF